MLGSALVVDARLKSNVPGRWHISQRFRIAG
jgi:hypothetical protein